MIERLARLPVEVDYGSEFRYRDPIIDSRDSDGVHQPVGRNGGYAGGAARGEAEGVAEPGDLQREGIDDYAGGGGDDFDACGAGDWRGFDEGVYGAIGGAGAAGVLSGRDAREDQRRRGAEADAGVHAIPHKMETILQAEETGFYETLARQYFRQSDFLYLGRGIHYPIALEGALKLKEISYIHAEGYPSGEMKHGPNALIDENLPVVVLATRDENDPASMTLYEKSVSNIKEVKARDGIVISVVTEGDHLAREASDHIIELPAAPDLLSPLLEIIPLQLLAYHIAVRRGCDVDQPRNLAKSVTVE